MIYRYDNYKEYVRTRLDAMSGRGRLKKLAAHLKIHTTRLSHILRGSSHFTSEHGYSLCQYLGLNPQETEYFLTLLAKERAGTMALKKHYATQAQEIRTKSQEIINRIPPEKILGEPEKAIFYSDWIYSAIRLATSISNHRDVESLADRFQIPRTRVQSVLDFLLSSGLCIRASDATIRMGPKSTHLESDSPLAKRHHTNWRLKAIQRHELLSSRELAYTCPVSIAKEDQAQIRERILQLIEGFIKTVNESAPEQQLSCLNIDWFEIY